MRPPPRALAEPAPDAASSSPAPASASPADETDLGESSSPDLEPSPSDGFLPSASDSTASGAPSDGPLDHNSGGASAGASPADPVAETIAAALPLAAAALDAAAATPTTPSAQVRDAGPFSVSGGVAGSQAGEGDYFYDAATQTLHIQTSTPLRVSTTGQVSSNIEIDPGVAADLTLAGVDILTTGTDNRPPINLVTNVYDIADNDGKSDTEKRKATHAGEIRHRTMLYLTLADNSVNKLQNTTSAYNGAPGIRCGWGSVLVIDDELRNLDQKGAIVTPANGLVPADITLIGGKKLKRDDPLSTMDSPHPGSLSAKGDWSSAGIGSGPKENAGTIIINGGDIQAESNYSLGDGNYSNAAGIGGGYAGSGTFITINGGNVFAKPGSCGAGIGAGQGHTLSNAGGAIPYPDAIEIPEGEENAHSYTWIENGWYHTVGGDITINGGFVDAHGSGHGNAIGESCTHGPASNKNHIIRITGGTVIAHAPENGLTTYEIGALLGYTIVTGGSVHVSSKSKFQGIGDTAFNTPGVASWADVTALGGSLPDSDKVEMVTIDMSSEINSEKQSQRGK